MLTIDVGNNKEYGSVIRTSLAMSIITNEPVQIVNIGGENGLDAYHLDSIAAAVKVSRANVLGAQIGSKEIKFYPTRLVSTNLDINVENKESISLILQLLMIPLMFSNKKTILTLTGSTDGSRGPPIDYIRYVLVPTLQKFGYTASIDVIKRGYFSNNSGRVVMEIRPCRLRPMNLMKRGDIKGIYGIAHASKLLEEKKIADELKDSAEKMLRNLFDDNIQKIDIKTEYCDSDTVGCGITLWAETENSFIGTSITNHNDAEQTLGKSAAENLFKEISSEEAVDRYMADQLLPYLSLATGSIRTKRITEETKAKIEVINRFGFNIRLREGVISV